MHWESKKMRKVGGPEKNIMEIMCSEIIKNISCDFILYFIYMCKAWVSVSSFKEEFVCWWYYILYACIHTASLPCHFISHFSRRRRGRLSVLKVEEYILIDPLYSTILQILLFSCYSALSSADLMLLIPNPCRCVETRARDTTTMSR